MAGKTIGKTTYQGGKKTCWSDLQEDKGKKKQTDRKKAKESSEEAMEQGGRKRKKLIKLEPEQKGTCQGEW